MSDPVMLSVAAAVAGKAAEAAFESGKTALAALVRLIRDRLTRDAQSAALDSALTATDDDPAAAQELARVLQWVAAEDPGFAAQVRTLWPQVQVELSARDSAVVNTSTGTVSGHLVQARDLYVQGNLQLGDVHDPSQP
jgi:hypothetical protein